MMDVDSLERSWNNGHAIWWRDNEALELPKKNWLAKFPRCQAYESNELTP